MTSTLPGTFPEDCVREIAHQVLCCFRSAEQAQVPLAEVIVHFAALKVLARELRGGAMVFLMPQSVNQPAKRF